MNKKVFILVACIFLVLVVLSYNKIVVNKIDIKLNSRDKVTLNIGDTWNDPGYVVSNLKYHDRVQVKSNLDINKEGIYKVDYILKVGMFSKKVTREVSVVSLDKQSDIVSNLYGDNPYYLMNGREYIDDGIKVKDIYDGDLTNRVVINNNVQSNVDGNYEVVYEVTNSSGITKKIIRNVIVYSFNFTGKAKYSEYRQDNDIVITINDKQYAYTILPNNEKNTSRDINYKVEENGLYTFYIYDKNNNSFLYQINITNIDKEEPTGTCILSLSDFGGTIKVDALDNNEILEYEYSYGNNKIKSKDNSYQINTLDEEAEVTIYDTALNNKTISCNTVDNSTKNSRSYKLLTYTYKNKEYKYWLYMPQNTKRNKIPLVVYFHGDGGRSNPENINKYALPKYINSGKDYPFYMIAPYCSNDIDFSHESYMEFVINLISYITNNYSVDSNRVIISGGSSGARGAYAIAATYKKTFSSMVIISGITYQLYEEREKNLTYLPIWVFHGKNDTAVDYNTVKMHVNNINSYGGNVRLTTYEGGHDSTDVAFETKEVIDWMISQRRKG